MSLPAPRYPLTTLLTCLALILAGCSSNPFQRGDGAPNVRVNVDAIPDPVPRNEPLSRYGNPDSYVVHGKRYTTLKSSEGFIQRGDASWYGTKFHGRRTSSGEPYSMYAMTAAHKTLPLPTYVEVTNLNNGRRIIVKVNDRGPFHQGRIIDLSYVAAIKLGIDKTGTGAVEIRAIDPNNPTAHRQSQPQQATGATTLATLPVANTSQNLYLQVGAFSSRLNAENLRNRLQPLTGNQVLISTSSDQSPTIYRVRIGPLGSDEEVQQVASRLLSQGISNPSVVVD